MKIIGLLILAAFYAVCISKMILQKRKGIQTDQTAKGKQKTKVFYIDVISNAQSFIGYVSYLPDGGFGSSCAIQ